MTTGCTSPARRKRSLFALQYLDGGAERPLVRVYAPALHLSQDSGGSLPVPSLPERFHGQVEVDEVRGDSVTSHVLRNERTTGRLHRK